MPHKLTVLGGACLACEFHAHHLSEIANAIVTQQADGTDGGTVVNRQPNGDFQTAAAPAQALRLRRCRSTTHKAVA
jgi:hypothetical protein